MQPFDYALHYVNFANATPGVLVGMVVVTLQTPAGSEPGQSMPIASFWRGALRSREGLRDQLLQGPPPDMFGAIQARFSDRQDALGTPMAGDTDTIGVEIVTWMDGSRTLQINLLLQSWGNARVSLTPVEVVDGILRATGPSVGNVAASASYLISFSEGAPATPWQEPAPDL